MRIRIDTEICWHAKNRGSIRIREESGYSAFKSPNSTIFPFVKYQHSQLMNARASVPRRNESEIQNPLGASSSRSMSFSTIPLSGESYRNNHPALAGL